MATSQFRLVVVATFASAALLVGGAIPEQSASAQTCSPIMVAGWNGVGANGSAPIGTQNFEGQTFTPTESVTLSRVSLLIIPSSAPAPIRLAVNAVTSDTGMPGGELASASATPPATFANTLVDFVFSPTLVLAPGTSYFLLPTTTDTSQHMQWRLTGIGNPYPGGRAYFFPNPNLVDLSQGDFVFNVFGCSTLPPPPAPAISSPSNSTVTGTSASGAVVTVSGVSNVNGATVNLLDGTTQIATGIPLSSSPGGLIFGTAVTLGYGAHSLTATQTSHGWTSIPSAAVSVTVQLSPPPITAPTDGAVTPGQSVTVSGTGVPGAVVTILDGTSQAGTAIVASSGAFTNTVNLAYGPHSLVATQSISGQTSGVSSAVSLLLFAYPSAGQFVVGNLAPHAVGQTVTFWAAHWGQDNPMTGGVAPGPFYGFEGNSAVPACGSTWVTELRDSSSPPSSVPSYMAVVASNSINKSGSSLSGDIQELLIVKTNPGYQSNLGHAGTGSVVGTVCRNSP